MTGIFAFDHDHGVPARELKDLLGGKGAGLAEMTATLGFNVPPGFTITAPICREYQKNGWSTELESTIEAHVARLGSVMGRRFGDPADPLLVAVRSGAPESMPGMLDTVLNLGLNDKTVEGLARCSGNEYFAWDSYRRFLLMYATTVLGVPQDALPALEQSSTVEQLRALVGEVKEAIAQQAGRAVPQDPQQQLREAIEAVFCSWESDRARAYREYEGLTSDTGTACNVQAMVFGNRGANSGTGVVFTRDPSTGEARPYGDYLPCAQGEDVVAGTESTQPLSYLASHLPEVYRELLEGLEKLELHYRDVCDVEFTIENGKLWFLQTRIGKRGAVAAVRIAAEMAADPRIALTPQEVLERVPSSIRAKARAEMLAKTGDSGKDSDLLGIGLGASPGRVSGRVVLSAEDALSADDDVIMVRTSTSPEDVAGMSASVGILTTRGGLVSHAAVVARGWGIPAVVGADSLSFEGNTIVSSHGLSIKAGDVITIDGSSGCVWIGDYSQPSTTSDEALEKEFPELFQIEQWAKQEEVSSV